MANEIKITKVKREAHFNMKQAHLHEQHEIYFLLSGERYFTINDNIVHIGKGDLVIIPAGQMHRTTFCADNTHERIAILFDDSVLNPLYESQGREKVNDVMNTFFFHIPDGRRMFVEELMNQMLYEAEGIDELSEDLKRVYLIELIMFIIRCYNNGPEIGEISVVDELIQKAAKYIFENSEKNITLDEVASMFGMSSSYFSRKFKMVTGFGFKEYLIGVRIKVASEMLLSTNRSITEIALQCGFNDSNYFGDAFHKMKGVSPSKYRKNKGIV